MTLFARNSYWFSSPKLAEFFRESEGLRKLMLSSQAPHVELVRTEETAPVSYSGLSPRIIGLPQHEQELSQLGLWLMIRTLYVNPQFDRADLSAWSDNDFQTLFIPAHKKELLMMHGEELLYPLTISGMVKGYAALRMNLRSFYFGTGVPR